MTLYLFPHSQVTSADLLDFYRRVQPRLGKFMMHDYQFLTDVRKASPRTLLIGRLYDQWNTHQIADPKEAGESWANRLYANPCFRDHYTYWEWLNEVYGYTTDDPAALHARWTWMDTAMAAFYDRVKELDPTKHPLGGNAGTGNMTGDEMVTYFPQSVKRYSWWGGHGYGFPTVSADAQYQVLRYRDIMAGIRSVTPHARGILTETGITHMVIPGFPDIGYTDIMTPDEYWCGAGNLSWLNDRLIEDKDFMEGGAVFQFEGEPEHWQTFECVRTAIVDYMEAIAPGTPAVDLGGGPVATFSYAFGFLARYNQNPAEVGEPMSAQIDIPNVASIQFTANGMMFYNPVSSQVLFFRAA